MRKSIGIIVFGLILSQWAKAQSMPDVQYGSPLFSAEISLVNITIVVLGRSGEPLPRLGKENFKVEERKIGEKNFHEAEINLDLPQQLPLRGGMMIDTSGSSGGQFLYQLDVASEIVKWIFRTISDESHDAQFFVAEFYYEPLDQNPIGGIFTLKQDWTGDIKNLIEAIITKTKRAAGHSPLFGSVRSAAEKFNTESGNFANFLIVVSDGENNTSLSSLKDSTYLAQKANLPIYTIGTASHDSTKVDPALRAEFERNLKETSRLTGGRFFDLPSQDKLPEIAGQILKDLRNQYHISYKLDSNYEDGDEIQIRIEVGNKDKNGKWRRIPAKLLHRNGYRVIKND